MDHLKTAQDIIDEAKHNIPEGVVVDVMEQLQAAYDCIPKNLYRIHYIELSAVRKNEMDWEHKSMLVEEVELSSRNNWHWTVVFNTGTMPPLSTGASWQGESFERMTAFIKDTVCVIKKIEQIMTHKKRKTEEAD